MYHIVSICIPHLFLCVLCGCYIYKQQWQWKSFTRGLKKMKSESHSVVSDSLRPHTLYSPWNPPGQNTGVGSLSLLQGIFPTRDRTQVSRTAGRFFTSWATREAQEYWNGLRRDLEVLGWKDPLEKGKATHSSILAWRIPWAVQSIKSQSQARLSHFHFHFRGEYVKT